MEPGQLPMVARRCIRHQQSTSRLMSVAWSAMRPALRPMSLVRPTPFTAPSVSTCPVAMACCAASTAVWNPNEPPLLDLTVDCRRAAHHVVPTAVGVGRRRSRGGAGGRGCRRWASEGGAWKVR
ncbi:Os06g0275250 [Oryza sativa Japonica Group]|uniref:Os06g0275250 protein n=1 Tax=Oryza sativa subsp. japonica TaxID=39947 RepID=A0A0N7KLX4_ORYSJ|nr:Os06g0275250 [Oryza sativa Japonica Group]